MEINKKKAPLYIALFLCGIYTVYSVMSLILKATILSQGVTNLIFYILGIAMPIAGYLILDKNSK